MAHRTFASFSEADADTWRIEWSDNEPSSRKTTLPAMAWFAHNYDEGAEVTAL